VCAGGPEPQKGMHDADTWLDHKTILNLGWKCGQANGSEMQGLFGCTVGHCPLSMLIGLDGLGPILGTIGCALRGENNLS
jgi:hypothetical protein